MALHAGQVQQSREARRPLNRCADDIGWRLATGLKREHQWVAAPMLSKGTDLSARGSRRACHSGECARRQAAEDLGLAKATSSFPSAAPGIRTTMRFETAHSSPQSRDGPWRSMEAVEFTALKSTIETFWRPSATFRPRKPKQTTLQPMRDSKPEPPRFLVLFTRLVVGCVAVSMELSRSGQCAASARPCPKRLVRGCGPGAFGAPPGIRSKALARSAPFLWGDPFPRAR